MRMSENAAYFRHTSVWPPYFALSSASSLRQRYLGHSAITYMVMAYLVMIYIAIALIESTGGR